MSGIQYNINQIPYGNIVAFVATDESIPKIEQIIYGYHQLRKFPIKYIITDEPKHDGVIVARRFNIGNFGTNAIVTINKLLYKKTNEDAIEAFARVLLNATSYDSHQLFEIRNTEKHPYFDESKVRYSLRSNPLPSKEEEDDEEQSFQKPQISFKDLDEFEKEYITKPSLTPISVIDRCLSLFNSKAEIIQISNEEKELSYQLEVDKLKYIKLISSVIIDYVTKFNEIPPMEVINEVVTGKLSLASSNLSTISVNNDFKVILSDYQISVPFTPLFCTLYILFLKHPDGIILKHISDYYDELEEIYSIIKPGGNNRLMKRSIKDLCNPEGDSLRQKISKINRIINSIILNPRLAENYTINGYRGGAYRISIPPEMIKLPNYLK